MQGLKKESLLTMKRRGGTWESVAGKDFSVFPEDRRKPVEELNWGRKNLAPKRASLVGGRWSSHPNPTARLVLGEGMKIGEYDQQLRFDRSYALLQLSHAGD